MFIFSIVSDMVYSMSHLYWIPFLIPFRNPTGRLQKIAQYVLFSFLSSLGLTAHGNSA